MNTDHLSIENNCKKLLNSFLDSFHKYYTDFQQNLNEISTAVTRIETLVPKLLVIEKVKANDIKCYTQDEIDHLTTRIVTELNDQYNLCTSTIEKIVHAGSSIRMLHIDFLIAANATVMMEESNFITGTAKRKSLQFYTEESISILHNLRIIINKIQHLVKQLENIRNVNTIKTLKISLTMPDELLDRIDKYLMFSSMIASQKKK